MVHYDYEVAIVGGGPAGLSAALVLGRCRRRVVLFDSGEYRNAVSRAVHGFLTRDGTDPRELRRIAREEIGRYPSVEIRDTRVVDALRLDHGFELHASDGRSLRCRKLLLATGLRDELPSVEGAAELYGESVLHCPYCDGWEVRDQPIASYGRGDEKGGRFALALTLWSSDIVLCTDGPSELSDGRRAALARHGVEVREQRIARFERRGYGLRIHFADGSTVDRRAMFFDLGCHQRSDLAGKLGCKFDGEGGVEVGQCEETTVHDLYVVGDASRDVLQAIIGAGEGSRAAIAVNIALLREEHP